MVKMDRLEIDQVKMVILDIQLVAVHYLKMVSKAEYHHLRVDMQAVVHYRKVVIQAATVNQVKMVIQAVDHLQVFQAAAVAFQETMHLLNLDIQVVGHLLIIVINPKLVIILVKILE